MSNLAEVENKESKIKIFLSFKRYVSQIVKWSKDKFRRKHTYNLVMCAIFKDESRIFPEWILYYKELGVDHFFLYNHESTDNFQQVLEPYIHEGIVTLQDAPNKPWIHRFQWQREAYKHFLENYGQLCKWACYCDLDEFIVPIKWDDLPQLLAEHEQQRVGSIEIKWQCFGTSFVPSVSNGQLYTETLTLKANPEHFLHTWGKVIARPDRQVPWPIEFTKNRKESIHHAILKENYEEINISLEEAQVNHYVTRDQDFFYNLRMKIRNNYSEVVSSLESAEEIEGNFNKQEDKKIQKFISKIKTKIKHPNTLDKQCDPLLKSELESPFMGSLLINKRGYWEGGIEQVNNHAQFDKALADFLVSFFKKEGVHSVVDLGCGLADYVKTFLQNQIECDAYDGNPFTPQITGGLGKIADLSAPLDLNKQYDWVLSLEVGEHLPKEYEQTYLENCSKLCKKGIILSWAVKGQGGHGHFNEQNNDYIKQLMNNYGYLNDLISENAVRAHSTLPYFKNTIMVFRNK